MTIRQLYLFSGIDLVVLVVVAILTRATLRRIAGAMAGGAAFGVVALGILVLGEKLGWWHFVFNWGPYFLTVMLIGLPLFFPLLGFIFLITWRIARRFGWRGLAVVAVAAAVIGPPRDYLYMQMFPEWGSYGPGVAPFVATSASYVIMVLVGHGVMRLIAGPAGEDRLARRPWESS